MRFFSLALIVLATVAAACSAQSAEYYSTANFPSGRNEGQAIDTSKKRPVKILSAEEAKDLGLDLADQQMAVANIFHDNQFYIAVVPIDKVKKLFFIIEPFALIMSHSMLRFSFDNSSGLRLTHLINKNTGEVKALPVQEILNDLLVTTEVGMVEGAGGFNPMLGLANNYVVITRITSLTGRGVSGYKKRKQIAYQLALNFSKEEAGRALLNSMTVSDEANFNETYNTLTNNCYVFSFSFLKNGRPFLSSEQGVCARAKGLLNAVSEKLFPVVRWYPPLAAFILRWRGYRSLNQLSVSTMNNDPEFLRLANKYEANKVGVPVACGEILEPGA